MRLEEFSYHLPEGAIAQAPAAARSASRLLVASRSSDAAAIHTTFDHLPEFLHPGDLIYTGTPEGVGPVTPGDALAGTIAGVGTIALAIGPAQ